jgi:hypothetical protein
MLVWFIIPCDLHVDTNVSEEHTDSIFSPEVQMALQTRRPTSTKNHGQVANTPAPYLGGK